MRSKRAEGPGERRAVRGGPFKNIEVEHPARLLETREEESERGTERIVRGLPHGKRTPLRACVRAYVRPCVRSCSLSWRIGVSGSERIRQSVRNRVTLTYKSLN